MDCLNVEIVKCDDYEKLQVTNNERTTQANESSLVRTNQQMSESLDHEFGPPPLDIDDLLCSKPTGPDYSGNLKNLGTAIQQLQTESSAIKDVLSSSLDVKPTDQ